jgi:integron integrase
MAPSPHSPRLTEVRARNRLKHYSIRTEQAYADWIRRYVLFHGKRHPSAMGASEGEDFLTHLAVEGRVAAATQNRAKSALMFLYREVLGIELPWLDKVARAKRPAMLPTVTRNEVARVLARLRGVHSLIGGLLYGAGLRIMECVRLRVQDVDFDRRQILVRNGKGFKDRVTMLPDRTVPALYDQLDFARDLHWHDLDDGSGDVWLPYALARKWPSAGREWQWQYVFPAEAHSQDPRNSAVRRHQLSDQAFQRATRPALRDADISKPATPHTLRYSFVTHLLESATTSEPCRSRLAMRTSAP